MSLKMHVKQRFGPKSLGAIRAGVFETGVKLFHVFPQQTLGSEHDAILGIGGRSMFLSFERVTSEEADLTRKCVRNRLQMNF